MTNLNLARKTGLAVFMLLSAPSAFALDLVEHPGNVSKTLNAILAKGEIQNGDTQKLAKFIGMLPSRRNTAIYFGSSGGSLSEGIVLGRFLRAKHIKSVIEGGELCASACALAFLGGTNNNGRPWRSSSTTSKLGFHAFRFVSSSSANTDETQKVVAEILEYGKSVDAPLELLIAGFATSSNDIYWVNNSEICALGIKLWSVEQSKFLCR